MAKFFLLSDTLGVIRVRGADAASFLHGQLSQDFLHLKPEDGARLALFCNAKGRIQTSFMGLRVADNEFLLVCSKDLLERTLKRLSMFVLRAKVRLEDASAQFRLVGKLGNLEDHPAETADGFAVDSDVYQVALPSTKELARSLFLYPHKGIDLPYEIEANNELWDWAEVMSGVARISAATFEQFIPQMLNYESCGGVNFQKGCYPGQEVIARSQFRGTLKRRAYLVSSSGDPLVDGQEVLTNDGESAGVIVQAARTEAIACLRIADAENITLNLLDLPYTIAEDI